MLIMGHAVSWQVGAFALLFLVVLVWADERLQSH